MKRVKATLLFSVKSWLLLLFLGVLNTANAQFIAIKDPAFRDYIATRCPTSYRADTLGGALDTIAAKTCAKTTLNGMAKNILSADEIVYFSKLDTIFLMDNSITKFNTFKGLNSLIYISLLNNKLTSLSDIYTVKTLKHLSVKNNQLTTLPKNLDSLKNSLNRINVADNYITTIDVDFSKFTFEWFIVNNNYLSFEDILPLTKNNVFNPNNIFPQKQLPLKVTNYKVVEDENLIIDSEYDQSLTGITYYLYKGNTVIETATTGIFTKQAALTDEGTYYVELKSDHPLTKGYSLQTQKFQVEVTPKPTFPFVENEGSDAVLSPNGDGVQDFYDFREKGEVKIINSAGVLVNEFATPYQWHATDKNGNTLKPDYYLIIINNAEKKYISIQY